MPGSLDARLRRLEAETTRERWQLVVWAAARVGMDVYELWAECQEFLNKPLAEQLAEVDDLVDVILADGVDPEQVKTVLMRAATQQHPT
jgi:hypothetical protein